MSDHTPPRTGLLLAEFLSPIPRPSAAPAGMQDDARDEEISARDLRMDDASAIARRAIDHEALQWLLYRAASPSARVAH